MFDKNIQCALSALLVLLPLSLMNGCASTSHRAPVSERSAREFAYEPDTRPATYTVRKGDTLFSIALDYGLDYKELAAWNGISNPRVLTVGRKLRLRSPVETASPRAAPPVAARSLGAGPTSFPEGVKSQPKAVKLPYSEQAAASLSQQSPPDEKTPTDDENVNWGWPTKGKLAASFNEATNSKGIDIAGTAGQSVLASAAGTVLYSGTGIRGYGKLIVLKHNKTYSSVYGYNSVILVKEGQNVIKGQKIAEMGNTDTDQVKLHFEIRRLGKPIDPVKLLPAP
jgi:lipoprotein NlpD